MMLALVALREIAGSAHHQHHDEQMESAKPSRERQRGRRSIAPRSQAVCEKNESSVKNRRAARGVMVHGTAAVEEGLLLTVKKKPRIRITDLASHQGLISTLSDRVRKDW